jgi:hypothetical protein
MYDPEYPSDGRRYDGERDEGSEEEEEEKEEEDQDEEEENGRSPRRPLPDVIKSLLEPLGQDFVDGCAVSEPHDSQTIFAIMVQLQHYSFFRQFNPETRALLCREMTFSKVPAGARMSFNYDELDASASTKHALYFLLEGSAQVGVVGAHFSAGDTLGFRGVPKLPETEQRPEDVGGPSGESGTEEAPTKVRIDDEERRKAGWRAGRRAGAERQQK